MRGKNAKALRRFAEEKTKGLPMRVYQIKVYQKATTLPGGTILPYKVYTRSLSPCTRLAYRRLKAQFKRLRQKGLYVGRQVSTARA